MDAKPNTQILAHAKKAVFSIISLVNILLVVSQLQHINAILYYLLLCFSCAFFVLSIALTNLESILYKTIMCVNLITLILILLYSIALSCGLLAVIFDKDKLRLYIDGAGVWGLLILFIITVLEIVVLPVPAAVTIVIGTYLYGATVSFIIGVLGTLLGSIICFFMGRIFGKRLINWIIGEEKTNKYSLLIEQNGKLPFIVMMLFPFFPDDILCMVVGLTNMSFRFFIFAITLTRPVMVAFYAYFGAGEIIPFSGWGIPVWIILFCLVFGVMYVINSILTRRSRVKNN